MREGRLAFVTSKGSGGGHRRRSAGREGGLLLVRTLDPRPTLSLVSPERCLEGRAGREGHRRPCLPPCWPRGAPGAAAPAAVPARRVAEAESLKARMLRTRPSLGGRSRSVLSPSHRSRSPAPTARGASPVSPMPDEAPCPPPTRCSLPAGLWAPTSTRNGVCPGRYRRPSRCQAGGELALLWTGPSGCRSSLGPRSGASGGGGWSRRARRAMSSPRRGVRSSRRPSVVLGPFV